MKKTNIILLVLVAVCIAVIVTMVGDFSTYETFATAKASEGKDFRVISVLDTSKAMEYDALKDANRFTFYAKDKAGEVHKVIFSGTKPTDFEKAESVVLLGNMKADGDFHCREIQMKCPSKYKKDQVAVGKNVM